MKGQKMDDGAMQGRGVRLCQIPASDGGPFPLGAIRDFRKIGTQAAFVNRRRGSLGIIGLAPPV
jgi:hypothetical protein